MSSFTAARRALLALIVLGMFSGCTAEVYHDLDEASANEMVVALEQHGVEASKAPDPAGEGTWLIEVPTASQTKAWQVLKASGLPRPKPAGFEQVFSGSGLVPTAEEERMKFQYATAQELRHSLLAVDGIVDANVNLVLPAKQRVPMPNQEQPQPRASVLVKYRAASAAPDAEKGKKVAHATSPISETEIKDLVSGGVEGMAPEHVRVILKPEAISASALAKPDYVQLGPLSIAPESQGAMRALVGVIVVLMLALVGLVSFLVLKLRGATDA
jgi:type III secretion protein J